MKRIAVITGASSGIGRDFARIIDKKEAVIDEIWLLGRDENRLRELMKHLKHPCKVFPLDLTIPNNLSTLSRIFYKSDIDIKILVNAAGFGIDGEFSKQKYSKIKALLKLNIEALTILTYDAIKYMKNGARIINIASSAGFLPQPYFGIYAASKSYVLSFSRALREELRTLDIAVTAVCPGPVDTRFFNNFNDIGVKIGMINRARSIDVALYGYKDNLRNKSVSVYGNQIKIFRVLCKIIPHDLILKIYTRIIDVNAKCIQRSK